jgi:hypothetical protein
MSERGSSLNVRSKLPILRVFIKQFRELRSSLGGVRLLKIYNPRFKYESKGKR